MKAPVLIAAIAVLATACSKPHVFEVDVGDTQPQAAQLVLYDTETPMERTRSGFRAERPNRADGDGRIVVSYANGRNIVCPIAYVSSREEEPHRYAIRDGQCQPE